VDRLELADVQIRCKATEPRALNVLPDRFFSQKIW
jgi:hypothetical protein